MDWGPSTHPLILAGPPLAQKTGIPWVSTVLAPSSLWSDYDPFVPPTAPRLHALLRLGVARTISRASYEAGSVAGELKELLENPSYAQRAEEVGRQVRAEDGAAKAVDLILKILGGEKPKEVSLPYVRLSRESLASHSWAHSTERSC